MKSIFFSLLFCLTFVQPLAAEPPAQPVHVDEALGLAFPPELAGLRYRGLKDYTEHREGLGYSLRYEGKGPQKLDVYFYDKQLKEIPDGVENDLIRKESSSLISDLRYVEKMGQYEDLRILATDEKIESGEIAFLRNRFEYVQVKKPAYEGTLASVSLVTGWGGSFVKVRYTYALSEKEQGEKIANALPGALAAVLSAGGAEVREAYRKTVLDAIDAFRKNPHDGEAGRRIGHYAMDSAAVSVVLSDKSLPWFIREEESEDSSDEPSEEDVVLMMAFLAGNVEAQIRENRNADRPHAGALQVIRTYRQLKEKNGELQIPEVEAWIRLQEEGKLGEHLEK